MKLKQNSFAQTGWHPKENCRIVETVCICVMDFRQAWNPSSPIADMPRKLIFDSSNLVTQAQACAGVVLLYLVHRQECVQSL